MKRTRLKRKTGLRRGTVKRKARKPTLTGLKKKCWALLSKCIRVEYSVSDGWVECVTCGATKPWKQMQAGHFIDGRFNAILFDERGIHPQCSSCNVVFNGRKEEYFIFMEKRYGRDVIDQLRRQRNENVSWTREELEERLSELTKRWAAVKADRGIE